MSDIPLETCWAFNELWNNKFRYQVASRWSLLLKNKSDHRVLGVSRGRTPISVVRGGRHVFGFASHSNGQCDWYSLLLATSSSNSCLQFDLFSTKVQGWILMCGRTVVFYYTGSGRNTWRFGNTVVSGTVGVGNLSLSALLAKLKTFQLPWSAGV